MAQEAAGGFITATIEAPARAAPPRLGAGFAALCFAVCAATYVVNAADRVIFPVLLRPLSAEYGFTLAQGGFLATIYVLGLGLGGIATGYLVERASRKRAMIAGILIYSLFTILTASARAFPDMAFYRVMTGWGEAMQNVALVIAVGAFYARSRTLAIGLVQCALGLGSFLGPRLGARILAETGDWRMAFYAFGAAGLLGAAALLFVSTGFTEQSARAGGTPAFPSDDAHMPESLWNRNVVCVLLAGIFRAFPFFAFLGLYTSFLTAELHFSLAVAAGALSLFGLGPFFSPVAGYIADRTNQKLFQIAMLATMGLAGYLAFNVATTPLAQDALALLEGVSGGFAYVNGYSLAQRSVRNALVGRVSGFYYASTSLPAAFSGYLLARLVEMFGWGMGATILIAVMMIVPILISLAIDTAHITGPGRRLTPEARLWT